MGLSLAHSLSRCQEITEKIGMDRFNSQLQTYLERALRLVATEVMLQRGGVETTGAGGNKEILGLLRGELEEAKQLLAKAQEETKQEVQETRAALARRVQELQEELAVAAEAQEQRMAALETKVDAVLGLLAAQRG